MYEPVPHNLQYVSHALLYSATNQQGHSFTYTHEVQFSGLIIGSIEKNEIIYILCDIPTALWGDCSSGGREVVNQLGGWFDSLLLLSYVKVLHKQDPEPQAAPGGVSVCVSEWMRSSALSTNKLEKHIYHLNPHSTTREKVENSAGGKKMTDEGPDNVFFLMLLLFFFSTYVHNMDTKLEQKCI